jgi:hypothetical protein
MGRPLRAPRELAGQTFGGWLVVGPAETPDPSYPRRIAYLCRCSGCALEYRVWRDNVLAEQLGCMPCAHRARWSTPVREAWKAAGARRRGPKGRYLPA